ncbi:MAG: hypothetical protein M0Q88_08005 [Bacilli bacterium]|nr:hypothetical protein [Bacilli bacterium]
MGEYVVNKKKGIEIKIGVSQSTTDRCFLTSKEELIKLRDMGYSDRDGYDDYDCIESYINNPDTIYESYQTAIEAQDEAVESIWDRLTDILFDENENKELILSDKWHIWDKGTSRNDIWGWFNRNHSKGIRYLLY